MPRPSTRMGRYLFWRMNLFDFRPCLSIRFHASSSTPARILAMFWRCRPRVMLDAPSSSIWCAKTCTITPLTSKCVLYDHRHSRRALGSSRQVCLLASVCCFTTGSSLQRPKLPECFLCVVLDTVPMLSLFLFAWPVSTAWIRPGAVEANRPIGASGFRLAGCA